MMSEPEMEGASGCLQAVGRQNKGLACLDLTVIRSYESSCCSYKLYNVHVIARCMSLDFDHVDRAHQANKREAVEIFISEVVEVLHFVLSYKA